MAKNKKQTRDYFSWKDEDRLLEQERAYLKTRKDKPPGKTTVGLALSGGGIRSASFALGLLQAMAKYQLLKQVDYLSTVSGGGYIGSSLAWVLHKTWKIRREDGCVEETRYGLEQEDFPFGTRPNQRSATGAGSREKMSLLRHLRQNINYLFPGGCLDYTALLSALLRGMFINILVYGPVLVFLLMLLALIGTKGAQVNFIYSWLVTPTEMLSAFSGFYVEMGNLANFFYLALAALVLGILLSIVYGVAATFGRFFPAILYVVHRCYYCIMRYIWIAGIVFLILGTLPYVINYLHDLKLEGGILATLGGILSGIWSYVRTSSTRAPRIKIPTNLIVTVAAILLIYGVLILGYLAGDYLLSRSNVIVDQLSTVPYSFWLLLVPLLFGLIININFITMHGYYRDRLMELFLPDVGRLRDKGGDRFAHQANIGKVQDICNYENGAVGPYHIINTNILLPGSDIPKFKGRGSDNFILSPRFCGSSATGWQPSTRFIGGKMTYSSAMAISGAAVNPNTGANGKGPTRNPLLSLVMSLLNLRLGVWVENPAKKPRPGFLPPVLHQPNLWIPALYDSFMPYGLNEKSNYVELSDGGHFENLAVYELIRREVDIIFVSDAAADKNFGFTDLANLIEKVRLDFGAQIGIDIDPMVPKYDEQRPYGLNYFAEKGYNIGTIKYRSDKSGVLVYVKSTITRNLPADIYSYKHSNDAFPDEPTSDQVFDENQFEAYRELGYQLAKTMIRELPDDVQKNMILT